MSQKQPETLSQLRHILEEDLLKRVPFEIREDEKYIKVKLPYQPPEDVDLSKAPEYNGKPVIFDYPDDIKFM